MPATAAQIQANRDRARLSTGPKTPEGKARSRRNGLKHGLSGDGICIQPADAAEADRREAAFRAEMRPTGEAGEVLVRRLAVLSVRMDRCVEREHAAIAANVAQAIEEFEAPEGVDEATADLLRDRAATLATFDSSPEACLARRYEAAAERGFFRALKELRQVEREAGAEPEVRPAAPARSAPGSSCDAKALERVLASLPAELAPVTPPKPADPPKRVGPARNLEELGSFHVPITIGRRG